MVSIQEQFVAWELATFLNEYPRLAIIPAKGDICRIEGWIEFSTLDGKRGQIEDAFEVRLDVPLDFPDGIPLVTPLSDRIPKDFHRLQDGALCLGSPTRQLLLIKQSSTISGFVRSCLLPYLFGFNRFEAGVELPFGELAHGRRGILDDMRDLFRVTTDEAAISMARLTARPRRSANKQKCPCGSGLRLGKCHHRRVNYLRTQLGRQWFRDQFLALKRGGKNISS